MDKSPEFIVAWALDRFPDIDGDTVVRGDNISLDALGLDSLDKIELTLDIEMWMDECISDEVTASWKTTGDILAYIKQKQEKNNV